MKALDDVRVLQLRGTLRFSESFEDLKFTLVFKRNHLHGHQFRQPQTLLHISPVAAHEVHGSKTAGPKPSDHLKVGKSEVKPGPLLGDWGLPGRLGRLRLLNQVLVVEVGHCAYSRS